MGKRFETIAAMACMTTLLMLFNFIFMCTGLVMLISGIYMRLRLQDYVEISTESSGAALLGISCLGAFVTLIGIFACCCTARGHPALLYLYGGFLVLVALLELCAGASVYAYRTSLIESFDQGLNKSMTLYGSDETTKMHIDIMQSKLQCCGNRAYTDWRDITPPKDIPTSCCKVSLDDCKVTDNNDIFNEGCYRRVIDFINSNVGMVAATAIGVAFFPLIGVFLACCLANHINKSRYEQVS